MLKNMEPREFQIKSGTVIARTPKEEDIPAMINLHHSCFPATMGTDEAWREDQLLSHLQIFEEGQVVLEREGKIIGVSSSLIVTMGRDPLRHHTYYGITDDGYFYNHDPQGDTLYGAEVYVDPACRGEGAGAVLYKIRRDLCKRWNLRRILAGGRLWNYEHFADQFTPEEYVHAVQDGKIKDPVMGFQLREGFVVRDVMANYIRDPRSKNYATLIEWLNPVYQQAEGVDRKVRVACVQYQMRKVSGFEDFAAQVRYFVETAGEDYGVDYVLFPEFFSVQLLSALGQMGSREGIRHLAEFTPKFCDLMSTLAREQGLHLIAGSHPVVQEDGTLHNEAMLFRPDGSFVSQPKLHITPSEKTWWGISGGNQLLVIQTPKAKIGILICYDVEFPEAARYLAEQGVEILFVPYCTDNRQGYLRVTKCAAARAIENQIYVVCSGVVGNLPDVPAMDIHYGRAVVFTPSDFEFARDGIQAESDPNVETMLVTDLDISDLYRSREAGSVTPLMDRRRDLFELKANLDTPLK
ncbi:bifunctional GNAT family N-acetyltransferase/carbon-nitrogen hydrolase family protein [Luteolibacter pohnpeiensis]|uniref:Bifunctional GNAT family N-acetyltransferase/carbon-nitrogen hydrolase family protein n=1 Tax=Luteolibacter pohnpeiensis TaxID=454153 RepID=A0A934S7G2_9BACT|nr:carbon-nitrogen hydrolase family protein [Luteolibacter pohnpeiensis]MBK1883607.1 bifunctional GNAT family N-acetyltransferase/carbon-nitrogen hydrolase family protein [Luteolibacter pohnpeiensis]